MTNPYKNLPDTAFWRRSVSGPAFDAVDPVSPPPFKLGPQDRIATAGSCFAQHIARTLKELGFKYLETETGPIERSFGVFSARFGNVYTTRQLLQLLQRAYGLFVPDDVVWILPDGCFVDPYRPQVEPGGYSTVQEVIDDRQRHLVAVREMFETCDVFVFTLGLTEGWRAKSDGAVFPLAPGVSGAPADIDLYEFCNFTSAETTADLKSFIYHLRVVNPDVRLIFTVSPVPLMATYEPRHVLVSTVYSKSALRVAAEDVVRETPGAAYYPSYEIITGHHTGYRYFADDLRSVTNEGVDRAMLLFTRHFLAKPGAVAQDPARQHRTSPFKATAATTTIAQPLMGDVPGDADVYAIICDEEALDR
jgi:hypothetical protein